jgi:hypothetical protein
VYLMIVVAALTGSPEVALLVGVLFGLVRGLAVFLGRRITNTTALADFHRRFMAADRYALAAIIFCEAAAILALLTLVSPSIGWPAVGVLGLVLVGWALRRRRRQDSAPGMTTSVTTRSATVK